MRFHGSAKAGVRSCLDVSMGSLAARSAVAPVLRHRRSGCQVTEVCDELLDDRQNPRELGGLVASSGSWSAVSIQVEVPLNAVAPTLNVADLSLRASDILDQSWRCMACTRCSRSSGSAFRGNSAVLGDELDLLEKPLPENAVSASPGRRCRLNGGSIRAERACPESPHRPQIT